MLAKFGGKESDSGQANLFLLVGLTLSLIAIMLLFVRIGNANSLRTDAQTAADAAALAAAGIARDNIAELLSNGELPYSRVYENDAGRRAAEKYAQENGATLESIRVSDDSYGNLGNIVRVEVQSTKCQKKLSEDRERHWSDVNCTDENPDSAHVGNAAAIAKAVVPDCDYAFSLDSSELVGVRCAGETVQSFRHAQTLVVVQIAAEEGQYIYKPIDPTA
ncbi:pilus assembly protein TadG-related protein [Streptomonospora alba]|uniref:pilus assembly protein TadG-related protein n=1 Tax=Streptomonospora alba TaxID=183763 RepID=UPI0009FFFEC3|nr:pilus assembly protein TadG-related protein [Streptomonospora alba]